MELSRTTEIERSDKEVTEYPIDARPIRGPCIVIDNREFPDKKDYRKGSENDVWKLQYMFSHLLGFSFSTFSNLAASSVRKLLKAVAKVDYSDHQCFVCVILSHGDERGIMCSDGGFITKEEILTIFSAQNSPTLAGKPKIFIFQCCRGSKTSRIQENDDTRERMLSDIAAYVAPPNQHTLHVPETADTIIIQATNPGYRAYRHEERGSILIDALFNTFNKHKNKRLDFVKMITRVNNLVSRERIPHCDKIVGQVANVESTLRLDLYLPTIQWQDDS